MSDLLIALAVMVAVVGPLLWWVVRADQRRWLDRDATPSARKEEVA